MGQGIGNRCQRRPQLARHCGSCINYLGLTFMTKPASRNAAAFVFRFVEVPPTSTSAAAAAAAALLLLRVILRSKPLLPADPSDAAELQLPTPASFTWPEMDFLPEPVVGEGTGCDEIMSQL